MTDLRRNTNLVGIALMSAAVLAFSLNDVLGKWLVATYSVAQVLVLRSIAALAILAPFIWRAGRGCSWRASPSGPSRSHASTGRCP
jgi:hypothetical protein